MPPRTTTWRLACAVMLLTAGCGDADDSVSLVPVKGTITLNGDPLANATVSFVPDPANPAQTAGGDTTGPAGNYLANFKGRSGLAPGKYKIIVTPGVETDEAGVDSAVMEAFKDDPIMLAEMQRSAAAGNAGRAGKKSKKPEPPAEFDREVEAGGSVLDLDVKQALPTASK